MAYGHVICGIAENPPCGGRPGPRTKIRSLPPYKWSPMFFCYSGPPTWSDQLSSKGLGRSSAWYAQKGQTQFSLPPCKWSPFFVCRFWTSYMVRPTFIKRSWPKLCSICPNNGKTSFRFPHVNEVHFFLQILDLLHGPTNFHQKVLADAPLNMPK